MRKIILCQSQEEVYRVAEKLSLYGFTWMAAGELGAGLVPVRDWTPIWLPGLYDYMVDTDSLRAYYLLRQDSNKLIDEGYEALLASDYTEGWIE